MVINLPGGEFHNIQDPAVISETLLKYNAQHLVSESMILFSQEQDIRLAKSRRKGKAWYKHLTKIHWKEEIQTKWLEQLQQRARELSKKREKYNMWKYESMACEVEQKLEALKVYSL